MCHGRRFVCLGIGGRIGREFRHLGEFEVCKGEEERTHIASQRTRDPAPEPVAAAIAVASRQSRLLGRRCYVGSNEMT